MVKNFSNKKKLVKLFGKGDTPLNAIRITGHSGAVSLLGFGCLASPTLMPVGLGLIALGGLGDLADGFVARKFKTCSVDGARMDPAFDKVKHVTFCAAAIGLGLNNNPGVAKDLYSSLDWAKNNPILLSGIGTSLVVDYISQRLRGEIIPQFKRFKDVYISPSTANMDVVVRGNSLEDKVQSNVKAVNFGKFKTLLQTTTHIGLPTALICKYHFDIDLDSQTVNNGVGYILNSASVLGTVGIVVKEKENITNFYNSIKTKF